MKKTTYSILLLITLSLTGYTSYYVFTKQEVKIPITISTTATTTIVTPKEDEASSKKTVTTKTGKMITIKETNPAGSSLSTLTITTTGFATNTSIILEKNKLTNFFLADLNKDTYDELIITTQAQGSGSYGEVTIFTTKGDRELIPVSVPDVTEVDTKKGGLFEGYMGHDSFTIINGDLVREFPSYTKTDTSNSPTGPIRKILYSYTENNGVYSVLFVKNDGTALASTTPPIIISTTTKLK